MPEMDEILKNLKLESTPSYGNPDISQFDDEWLLIPGIREMTGQLPKEIRDAFPIGGPVGYATHFFDGSYDNYYHRYRLHVFSRNFLEGLVAEAKPDKDAEATVNVRCTEHYDGYENFCAKEKRTVVFEKKLVLRVVNDGNNYRLHVSNNKHT